jgi:hypothetical protein
MNIGTGVQAILRIPLRNLKGCNVGINDGRDLTKYAVELNSGDIIYVPSSVAISPGL